jgi:glycosyltransferase involved in cell wall biosynthesis
MIVWNEFRHDARVLKEAETLQFAGHAVTVFALHVPGVTKKHEVTQGGVRVVRITRGGVWSAAGRSRFSALKNLFRRVSWIWSRMRMHCAVLGNVVNAHPDVIHAHDINTLPTAWLAAVLARAPLIYDAHEVSTHREGYTSFRGAVACVEKALMPLAKATITTTDMRANFFVRAYGVRRPLVLQNRPRIGGAVASTRIRDELKLPEAFPIILYQGGLGKGRGLHLLVTAASKIKRAYFVVLGGGPLEQELRVHVRELKLQDRFHFIPTVALKDLPAYTASADIGVQPLEHSCFNHFSTDSNKLFEYVMGGLAIVASDLPEIRRVMKQYGLGLLIPPGDAGSLTNALTLMVESNTERERYRDAARDASSKLTWEAQEGQLLALYERVLAPCP